MLHLVFFSFFFCSALYYKPDDSFFFFQTEPSGLPSNTEGGAGRSAPAARKKEKGASACATCFAYAQLPDLPGSNFEFHLRSR